MFAQKMEWFSLKSRWLLLFVSLLLLGGIFYYLEYYKGTSKKEEAVQRFQKLNHDFLNMTRETVNLEKTQKDIESYLDTYEGQLPPFEEANSKIILSMVMQKDRKGAMEILKEVANNPKYPNYLRAFALNVVVDELEMNFLERDFAQNAVFTGKGFSDLYQEAGGDEALAIRKLNEWSVQLSPATAAYYRIALSYATELQKNQGLSEGKKEDLRKKAHEYLTKGGAIFNPSTIASRYSGLVYGIQARTFHLLGENKEADRYFDLTHEANMTPPLSVLRLIYRAQYCLYHAAFLAKVYGTTRVAEVKEMLEHFPGFFENPGQPKNLRFASFLIAARDSTQNDYPALDFNRSDIERLMELDPDFKRVVNELNMEKYMAR